VQRVARALGQEAAGAAVLGDRVALAAAEVAAVVAGVVVVAVLARRAVRVLGARGRAARGQLVFAQCGRASLRKHGTKRQRHCEGEGVATALRRRRASLPPSTGAR
jgi:hypothetical protein